ncbi:hypothetical protein DNHGIG_07820 [Collibacillus ludicampi]|uniref:Uncharacterized protein n=1 Tax=Collibacillus ludicampi TaxID=2771369 RepID=A0AAV4LBR4_9BACL|nr:hypothetical protein [Collibacillus ludicampi]GIM45233.1 hypothetical protein DNHGIG_07820 [Collibacillus ludicampi]
MGNNQNVSPANLASKNANDPMGTLGKEAFKRAQLTKGMWFIVILVITFLLFILAYSKIPVLNNQITLTSSDIRTAFWLIVVLAILLMIAFSIPDIRARWKMPKDKSV